MNFETFDTSITIGLRRRLTEELEKEFKKSGYTNYEKVLDAISQIPRHYFLAKGFEVLAYENEAIEIEADQTISQPLTVAIQTYILDIKPEDHILEIGTGSGYQAAVLCLLAQEVVSLERHEVLYKKSSEKLRKLGLKNVRTSFQDGFIGNPRYAPYDKILVTCGAPEIPQTLIDQLKIGGQMVLPKDDGKGKQDMIRLTKKEDGSLEEENFGKFMFVPMLAGTDSKSF
jgi:protein-L-isoaspartate(D-aspartate) O-methyltransferase